MRAMLLLLPVELVMPLVVAAGLALIVGARAFAGGLLTLAAAMVILPVLLAPLFDALPEWVLWAVVFITSVGIGLMLLRATSIAMIGRGATDGLVGILAANFVQSSLRGAVRLMGWSLSMAFRGVRALLRL